VAIAGTVLQPGSIVFFESVLSIASNTPLQLSSHACACLKVAIFHVQEKWGENEAYLTGFNTSL
jgi:hypothetical protein